MRRAAPTTTCSSNFEATTLFTDEEKHMVETVIESILLNHQAKRWDA
jgi:hypothetical protein